MQIVPAICAKTCEKIDIEEKILQKQARSLKEEVRSAKLGGTAETNRKFFQ